jgi:S-formylglutathione hydrolase FrmB
MAFATVNYYSHALAKASQFNIVFPDSPDAKRPWSTLYLLHGLSDDHTTWMRRSCPERYTLGYPLVVVMPDGGRGWYTNAVEGDAYEDDLMDQVMGLVEANFPVKAQRSARAIGGLSMGGFGAIKLALKYPDRFASAHSSSGIFGLCREPAEASKLVPEIYRIFGKHPKGCPEDPYVLAEGAKPRSLPALRVDCGLEDPFLAQNRAFHEHLTDCKIAHDFQESNGTHSWSYWDRQFREALAFHARHLKLPDEPEHALLR